MADVLTRHGHLRVRALGSSMFPAIRPADVLCIEHCTPEAVRPGDVLVTRYGERVLAHFRSMEKRTDAAIRADLAAFAALLADQPRA